MPKARGMSGERWRELKSVKPRFRWARDEHGNELKRDPSARRAPKSSTSARMGRDHRGKPVIRATSGHRTFRGVDQRWKQREPSTEAAIVHLTKTHPWIKKRRARVHNAMAKQSRRVNRG